MRISARLARVAEMHSLQMWNKSAAGSDPNAEKMWNKMSQKQFKGITLTPALSLLGRGGKGVVTNEQYKDPPHPSL